jgi:hypothetical protein
VQKNNFNIFLDYTMPGLVVKNLDESIVNALKQGGQRERQRST